MSTNLNRPQFVVAMLLSAGVAIATFADIIEVPGDFSTIQQAIDAATHGDEIIVGPGEYAERIDLIGKVITVRSQAGPERTIINAGGGGSCVVCVNNEPPQTMIEGFTLTNGTGSPAPFDANTSVGGGLFAYFADPTVIDCIFINNSADLGGGMTIIQSDPLVLDCRFENNVAFFGGGGIVHGNGTAPTLDSCTFIGNSGCLGGAVFNDSGGLPTEAVMIDCVFIANDGCQGGAIYNEPFTDSVIASGCVFEMNTADFGGAIYNFMSANRVENCSFQDNTATTDGGAILNNNALPVIASSEFCGNVPDHIAGDFVDEGGNSFQDACTTPGDLDGDGEVGAPDLLLLLGQWGDCPARGDCPGDLDGDGVTGTSDLLILLGNWT